MFKKNPVLHKEPPSGFQPKFSVVLAYIEWNNKLLFLLTHPNKAQGLTWTAPGGKVEPGETTQQAVIREVKEETGIILHRNSLSECGKFFARNSRVDFNMQIFRIKMDGPLPSIAIEPQEHTEFRWLELHEITQLPLMEGADECLEWTYGDSLKLRG